MPRFSGQKFGVVPWISIYIICFSYLLEGLSTGLLLIVKVLQAHLQSNVCSSEPELTVLANSATIIQMGKRNTYQAIKNPRGGGQNQLVNYIIHKRQKRENYLFYLNLLYSYYNLLKLATEMLVKSFMPNLSVAPSQRD